LNTTNIPSLQLSPSPPIPHVVTIPLCCALETAELIFRALGNGRQRE
jgi:hypothetical protein